MELNKMKEIASRFVDIKSIVSSFLTVVVACVALYSYTDEFVDGVQNAIYQHVTEDFYVYVKSDLFKQLEKQRDSPDDVRAADVEKFSSFCGGYFGKVYAKRSPDKRKIWIACDIMIQMHTDSIVPK